MESIELHERLRLDKKQALSVACASLKLLEIHGDSSAPAVTDDKGEKVKVADLGEGAEQQEVVGA